MKRREITKSIARGLLETNKKKSLFIQYCSSNTDFIVGDNTARGKCFPSILLQSSTLVTKQSFKKVSFPSYIFQEQGYDCLYLSAQDIFQTAAEVYMAKSTPLSVTPPLTQSHATDVHTYFMHLHAWVTHIRTTTVICLSFP